MSKAKVEPANGSMLGKRKLYAALAVVGTLLLGLVLILLFKQMSDAKWSAWVYGTAGIGTAYITGNVVSKVVDAKNGKKK